MVVVVVVFVVIAMAAVVAREAALSVMAAVAAMVAEEMRTPTGNKTLERIRRRIRAKTARAATVVAAVTKIKWRNETPGLL